MLLAKFINIRYDFAKNRKLFHFFLSFWFLIALLEFAQDYISSVLNSSHFLILESLAYKIFWILFIPFTQPLINGVKRIKVNNKPMYVVICGLAVVLISFLHLIIFSFLLFGISQLIHNDDPWHLSWLLIEKFSNRLYIALASYSIIVMIYFWLKQRKAKNVVKEYSKTITVKNGRRTLIVNVNSIKWISSDGPYLFLYAFDKKHIISDSLKNIIIFLPENFKRIHRSTIVNIDMISELKSRMNGDYDVILKDTNILRLSRNYSKSLKGTLL